MEFLAKHGPLRQLDHYGRKLNIFEYYLIDIIGAGLAALFIIIMTILVIFAKVLRFNRNSVILKPKRD